MKTLYRFILTLVVITGSSFVCLNGYAALTHNADAEKKIRRSSATSVSYFIHPLTGNDANAGLSKDKPFKTLERVEKIKLMPGDKIILADGQVYEGSLHLIKQQGVAGAPIEVTSVKWAESDSMLPAQIDCGVDRRLQLYPCKQASYYG